MRLPLLAAATGSSRRPSAPSPLRVVEEAGPPALSVAVAEALLDAVARLHGAEDVASVRQVAVESIERLVRGSAAALFATRSDPPLTTLRAAGPAWRTAERDAPAWLAPLSGVLGDLVRANVRLAGRLVPVADGTGPDLALVPLEADGGERPALLVAWPVGVPARDADFAVLDQWAPHVSLALARASALEDWRGAAMAMRNAQAELVRSHAEQAAASIARGAAHELNNVLSVLLASTDSLLDSPDLAEGLRAEVSDLQQAAATTTGLAHVLGFIARTPREGDPGGVDLLDLVRAMADRLQEESAGARPPDIVCATSAGDWSVRAHPGDLSGAVLALLRQHAAARGGEVVVEAADDSVRLIVAAPEQTAVALDEASAPCYTRQTKWHGPVLAACRRLADHHGWQLGIEVAGRRARVVLGVPRSR